MRGGGGGGGGEKSFDGRPFIKLTPRKRPKSMPPVGMEEDDVEGPRGGAEGGYPPGSGGQPVPPNPKKRPSKSSGGPGKAVPIHDLRIVPLADADNRCRVSFMPRWSGEARLQFAEAGDSTDMPLDDIRACYKNGKGLDLDKVVLKEGERWNFEITSDRSMRNRAYCLRAWDVKNK